MTYIIHLARYAQLKFPVLPNDENFRSVTKPRALEFHLDRNSESVTLTKVSKI